MKKKFASDVEKKLINKTLKFCETHEDCRNFLDYVVKNGWSAHKQVVPKVKQFLRKYPDDIEYICGIFLHFKQSIDYEKPTPKYLACTLLEYGADPDLCLWGKRVTLFHDFVIDAHSEEKVTQRLDLQFIIDLGPSVDILTVWGNSVLQIVGMMLCQKRYRNSSIVQKNFIDLVNYGYNPLIKDQYFCRGHNALTCLYCTSPELYTELTSFVALHKNRRLEIRNEVENSSYCNLPCELIELISDFSSVTEFVSFPVGVSNLVAPDGDFDASNFVEEDTA